MGLDGAVEVAQLASGRVVANHLEALDHCPVTRHDLWARAAQRGLAERFHVPTDGDTLRFAPVG